MAQFTESLKTFFEPLSTAQKVLFGTLSVIVLSVMISVFVWATKPDYTLLFGSLTSGSAQSIIEELRTQSISYELRDNGKSIYVPRSKVYDLRIQFASEGMTDTNYKGYELFDSNTLGMTDFMQRVNLKRALEGELARTINNLSQVEFSRVHLVLPERSPFNEGSVEASSSVILNIKPSQRLSNSQIEGISALVAGSVEELMVENVTILDQKGNKISQNDMMAGDMATSNAQLKLQRETELYLREKGQTMLDRVLGAGNSILRVSTDHDFERISRNSQLIDPESRIVISEEQRTETNNNIKREPVPYDENDPPDLRGQSIDLGGGNSESQVKIRNYEVNTTQQSYEKPVGVVTRMSVSVLLDYKSDVLVGAEGQDSVVYTPYTNAEIRDIENVVRSALGIQIGRGDEVSITQIRFQDDFANEFMNQQVYYQEQIQMNEWLRWGLILLGLMAALGLLYGIVRRVNPNAPPLFFDMKKEIDQSQKQQKALPGQGSEDDTISEEEAELDYLDDDLDMYQRKLSPEAQRRLKMKSKMYDEVKNFAEFKSEDAANMVRSLLMQGKNSEGK